MLMPLEARAAAEVAVEAPERRLAGRPRDQPERARRRALAARHGRRRQVQALEQEGVGPLQAHDDLARRRRLDRDDDRAARASVWLSVAPGRGGQRGAHGGRGDRLAVLEDAGRARSVKRQVRPSGDTSQRSASRGCGPAVAAEGDQALAREQADDDVDAALDRAARARVGVGDGDDRRSTAGRRASRPPAGRSGAGPRHAAAARHTTAVHTNGRTTPPSYGNAGPADRGVGATPYFLSVASTRDVDEPRAPLAGWLVLGGC